MKTDNPGLRFGLSYFLFFAIYGIASPYLQIMLRGIGYSPSAVGILLGIFELIGIGGPIILARKADYLGAYNPFLMGSGFSIIVGLIVLMIFKTPIATIAGLGLISLGLKTPVPVLDASLIKTIEARTKAGTKIPTYGTLRSLGSAGYVLVAISVQFIPGFDTSPVWVMALAMITITLTYMVGLIWLPETGSGERPDRNKKINLSWVDSSFILGLSIIALSRLSMSAYGSFFSLYLIEYLDWHVIGAMSALAAVVEIPMLVLSWKIMKKRSPMAIIEIASFAIFARLLAYALVPTKSGVIVGQLLHSISYGLFQPAAVAFISLKTPPSERATGMALLLGLGIGLPFFLGSAFGGVIVEFLGYRWLFAIFSLFSVASIVLYRSKGAHLKTIR